MTDFAVKLAKEEYAISKKHKSPLKKILNKKYRGLKKDFNQLVKFSDGNLPLATGSEWILDNFYLLEQHIAVVQDYFNEKLERKLPFFNTGHYKEFPRVHQMASELVHCTDAKIDESSLEAFITGFQSISVLMMRELWAFAVMLRFALIENLASLVEFNVITRHQQELATNLVASVFPAESKDAIDSVSLLKKKIKGTAEYKKVGFAVQLIELLREKGAKASPCIEWLDNEFTQQGCSCTDIVNQVLHLHAVNQISIANIFNSLRSIASFDWNKWFEQMSVVHHMLEKDPTGLYSQSDFYTRDHCRKSIESLAEGLKANEVRIVEDSIDYVKQFGSQPKKTGDALKKSSIVFYLISDGLLEFEKSLGFKPKPSVQFRRWVKKRMFVIWFFSLIVSTLILLAVPFFYHQAISATVIAYTILLPAWIILASEVSIQGLQWLATYYEKPKSLPKLDYEKAIPQESRTLVCVHTMFRDRKKINKSIEQLKIQYLANRNDNIFYVLFADFLPATTKELPEDRELVTYAQNLINKINRQQRSSTDTTTRFLLIARERCWSHSEHQFIGWERKRGKVHQLNRIILGDTECGIKLVVGDSEFLNTIRFVITLDEDSRLPPGVAVKMIETIAHPLNSPVFDPVSDCVAQGYSIIQPRVGTSFRNVIRTRFSMIFATASGTNPYNLSISNIHQDLFEEGTFVGKGIYDVRAFERALKTRVDEERILSHDLFEGLFARVGFASNLEILDDSPSNYVAYKRRLYRWVRGDWQLLPWIGKTIPSLGKKYVATPLSFLSRWKMIDNLRRSLVKPAALIGFLAAWSVLPGQPLIWMAFVIIALNVPILLVLFDFFLRLLSKPQSFLTRAYHQQRQLRKQLFQALLQLCFLPDQAYSNIRAIVVTLYRLFVSHQHLLQWTTAADSEVNINREKIVLLREMLAGVIIAVVSGISIGTFFPERLIYAAFFIFAWLFSPLIAYFIAMPLKRSHPQLQSKQLKHLTVIAEQTFHYFDEFSSIETNYLIPDNVQFVPKVNIAMRTSPTNIGLHLLSVMSAYDLGFIQLPKTLEQLSNIYKTLSSLERFKGHFFNWYDIKTRQPLLPKYISTVDSGNLLSHMITLRSALHEIPESPMLSVRHCKHMERIFAEVAGKLGIKPHEIKVHKTFAELLVEVNRIEKFINKIQKSKKWGRLKESHKAIVKIIHEVAVLSAQLEIFKSLTGFEKLVARIRREKGVSELTLILQRIFELRGLRKMSPTWSALQQVGSLIIFGLHDSAKIISQLPDDNMDKLSIADSICQLNKETKAIVDFSKNIHGSVHRLIDEATYFINEMDFTFLYQKKEKHLAIGYQVLENKLDDNCYNLLASEALIASLCAIAKGNIPPENWYALGRPFVKSSAGKALLSWAGSVFEYLMPSIVINPLPNTILEKTYRVIVAAQIKYGNKHGLPWGISESGYGVTDNYGSYQYRAFGLPDLGLKRGLADDYVVSPYSTFLCLGIDPISAIQNIMRLEHEGSRGPYGFYEALDYTPRRLSKGEAKYILKSYLAHHQGMILTAINNYLNQDIFKERFHRTSLIESVDLLLQEPLPEHIKPVTIRNTKETMSLIRDQESLLKERVIDTPFTQFPRVGLLSNGSLSTMFDNAGSGYIFTHENIALTNWYEDAVLNNCGYYIFLRDLDEHQVWSLGFQPSKQKPEYYEVIYGAERIEIIRRDFGIGLHAQIVITPEHNVEIRQLILTNHSGKQRRIEVTSYGEVVLSSLNSHAIHPQFSKMFIESEFNREAGALIYKRTPREQDEQQIFAMHTVVAASLIKDIQWESARAKFIGRGNTIQNPQALRPNVKLSSTIGFTLDPIFSLRVNVVIDPNRYQTISYITGFAKSSDELNFLLGHYTDMHAVNRAFEISLARAEIERRFEHLPMNTVHLFQKFSQAIFYCRDPLRNGKEARRLNRLTQSALWRFGVSGDLPIVLMRFSDTKQLAMVKLLLKCHHYLNARGLHFDIFIINEIVEGYRAEIQNEIEALKLTVMPELIGDIKKTLGNVFIYRAEHLSNGEKKLLEAIAHHILTEKSEELIEMSDSVVTNSLAFKKRKKVDKGFANSLEMKKQSLEFFNGYGGFIALGKAYRILLTEQQVCPRPWSNVIAGREFGFIVTEKGGGYTWSENSSQNRLTAASNDSVTVKPSELLYFRNPLTKDFFSPFSPPDNQQSMVVEHHFGYTTFEFVYDNIQIEVMMSTALDQKVKWWRLTLDNKENSTETVEIVFYVEWVMGVLRSKSAPNLVCDFDEKLEVLYATNHFNGAFAGRLAYIGSSEAVESYTTSRSEFVGRHGDFSLPAALETDKPQIKLTNTLSNGADSCGVLKVQVDINTGAKRELLFYLAEADSLEEMREVAVTVRDMDYLRAEYQKTQEFWRKNTSVIEVATPDRSFDIMMNGWLIYQTISCRLFARSGFYQSSGAIGFRDQLQDALALLAINPQMTRSQILLHASRQFLEGDVQHWWMPEDGRGVRTRCSDDYLWLPYAVINYLEVTHDWSILDEKIPFIEGKPLTAEQQDAYYVPVISEHTDTLYVHCKLAIDHAFRFGLHGLPLIASGDWNDGMNLVGIKGKGESVWLGWFLLDILSRFRDTLLNQGDNKLVATYDDIAQQLLDNIEKNAWDGAWYQRAYFDDGTVLGSKRNDECCIDSISQSWSVIARKADPKRQRQAMDSVYKNLVDEEARLIKLLTPAFSKTNLNPGYIKAYPPGVRENGAQYTHAAAWVIWATALLGKGKKAFELFSMTNPINHSLNKEAADLYQGEPYVMSGDVYAESPYRGQAGWSWYTGSAGWTYLVGLEALLGLKIRGDHIEIDPCINPSWKEYKITYNASNVTYLITVLNPNGVEKGVKQISVSGTIIKGNKFGLLKLAPSQQQSIEVIVTMG